MNELFNDAAQHLRHLGKGIKASEDKFLWYYLKIRLGEGSYENQVGEICFRKPTVSQA
jgi:hypothetical protein